MRRRWIAAAMVIIGLCLAIIPSTAAAADPFVLFLLRMLRDQALSSAIESGATYSPQASRPPAAVALPAVPSSEADRMRRLIDESFVHLRPEQREELHASLTRILNDPKNAAQRGQILGAFTAQAEATRQSHLQLSRLTEDEMRAVAAGARVEFARLPTDQRREMLLALERGVPGMPRTLHELILAELRSVAAAR
jgi:hypothetical protein